MALAQLFHVGWLNKRMRFESGFRFLDKGFFEPHRVESVGDF